MSEPKTQKKGTNPMLLRFMLRVVKRSKYRKVVTKGNDSEGTSTDTTEHTHTYYVDKRETIKIFDPKQQWEVWSKLKPVEQRLYMYILTHIVRDKGTVTLKVKDLREPLQVKNSTSVFNAIKTLRDGGMIEKVRADRWYVNPEYGFNGNLVKHIQDYYPDNWKVVGEDTEDLTTENDTEDAIRN